MPPSGSRGPGASPERWRGLARNALGALLGVLVAWILLAVAMPLVITVYGLAQWMVHFILPGAYSPADDMAFFVVFLLYSLPFALAGLLFMRGRIKLALAIVVGIVGTSITVIIVVLLTGNVLFSF